MGPEIPGERGTRQRRLLGSFKALKNNGCGHSFRTNPMSVKMNPMTPRGTLGQSEGHVVSLSFSSLPLGDAGELAFNERSCLGDAS